MSEAADSLAVRPAAVARIVPESRPDFGRALVCVLGLPFDAIGVEQAVERIRHDAFSGRRCFVSTPNLNFAIAARSDAAFRGSVLNSDLSLVDGMPLVWIARLLGTPVPMRVSGADVFEALQAHAPPAVTVFLFGGPSGAAAEASDRINRRSGGVRCVGFETPGFGSIESMSDDAQIERINLSGAHFLVVALGAVKGQAWIEHNAARLTAPVLSHLGAVVNFAAGSVLRAPRWMQRAGLEWLWRIREEPHLWRRYGSDGLHLAGLLLTRVVPDAIASRIARSARTLPARNEVRTTPAQTTLALHGSWPDDAVSALRSALEQTALTGARLAVDLSGVSHAGGTLIALLLVAEGWFGRRAGFRIDAVSPAAGTAFERRLAADALSATPAPR